MKIYLDYIFLENLIVNLLISINMYKFNKEKLKKLTQKVEYYLLKLI